MRRLLDISLTRKLVYLILLVVVVVLAIVVGATLARDAVTSRQQMSSDLAARAELISKTLSVPVAVNSSGFGGYEKEVGEVLNFLHSDKHIKAAAVFLADGRRLQTYTRDANVSTANLTWRARGVEFLEDEAWVSTPIRSGNGDYVGTLVMVSDLTALQERLKEDVSIAVTVLLLSILIAVVMSASLQRLISRPILELAETADTVATQKNYSIRATKRSKDEIGHLVDRFNEMLSQIAVREEALRKSSEELERRVIERTAELSRANSALSQENAERRRVEEGLRQSEARFALTFKASPLAMCIASLDSGVILDTNGAFDRTVTGNASSVQGRTLAEAGIFPGLAEYRHAIRNLREDRPVHDYDGKFRTTDGTERTGLFSIARINLEQSPAALIIINDLTDRQSIEAQLRQPQKMEGIGQLAAGVAHDYNNILTTITGYVDMMSNSHKNDPLLTASLAQVSAAAGRAASLTRQLLAFSRRQVMQPRVVELNEVLTNFVKMLARVLGEHITLKLRLMPGHLQVRADIGMIEQVVTNLAVNARDAMPSGGNLTLTTEVVEFHEYSPREHPQARPGRFVRLRVTDTGCGMDAATLARVFEPFFTTKPVGKGTGLGLATAYGIVQQHQGWIEVQSQPGQGTEFSIFIPEAEDEQARGNTEYFTVPPRGGTETILVVEDEEPVRHLARVVLERAGYQVIEAGDGPEALKVWEEKGRSVNLVVTDLVMPNGMTGRQLATKLKTLRPGLKVIYTSGYSIEVAGRDLANEPDFHFLPKPYIPAALLRIVRTRLDATN